MTSKKAVVFDWDGTLFPSMPVKKSNFVSLFSNLGADQEQVALTHTELSGIPRVRLFSETYERCFGKGLSSSRFEELSATYTEMNLTGTREVELFVDAKEFLESNNVLKLFVSTSAAESEFRFNFDRLGMEKFIDTGLSSRPGFSKGPEHIGWIVEKTGFARDDLLFVGDEMQDMNLARSAGVSGIVIDRESRFPDYPEKIDNLNLLYSQLGRR